eukprot:jgi/Orpsp1_1/1175845/evm.model.c7180000055431.1
MLAATSIIGYFAMRKPFSQAEEELFKSIDYGKKINVNGHKMNVGIFGENNKKTIVCLPGLGQPSPVLDFKPLAEALLDKYKIVILEPFGCGLSDIIEDDRSLEIVTSEFHCAIKELGIEKYYLLAHSLYGLNCLHYATQYPEEILGFIGIDVTVPGQNAINRLFLNVTQSGILTFSMLGLKGLSTLGLLEHIDKLKPNTLVQYDTNYNYTEEEIRTYKILALKRGSNITIYNSSNAITSNIDKADGLKFPENIPVLNLISSFNYNLKPIWKELHEDVITDTKHSKVVLLEGGHSLHHDNREGVLKEIKEWLNELEN